MIPFPELRVSRWILALLACLVITGCGSTLPKPVPPPTPPPVLPTYTFDLVTIPAAVCEITIEGYAPGPQTVPAGYLYLGAEHPAYQSSIGAGAVMFNCVGYVTQIWTNQEWASLQANNAAGGHNFYTLTPLVPPMPQVPTKNDLMRAQYTFQGLRANCPQYDPRPLPIFDPMLDVVDDACFDEILRAHQNAGDQVIGVAISHQYNEPDVIPILRAGRDWTGDLPGLHAFLERIIRRGFYIQLHLAMDGHSIRGPDGQWAWNDPVGHTYGCEWGAEFFPKLADALDDIHGYIRFLPGYDGVFYGCEDDGLPVKIPAFARQFKTRFPDGVLGIEFNTGHLPFGEGDSDWQPTGRMRDFDLVFAEFDSDLNQDSTWQIIARLMKNPSEYHRPPEQPAGDDPNPPAYLYRWPGVAVCFEFDTYYDVRFLRTPAQVNANRNKLRAMGCPYVG